MIYFTLDRVDTTLHNFDVYDVLFGKEIHFHSSLYNKNMMMIQVIYITL